MKDKMILDYKTILGVFTFLGLLITYSINIGKGQTFFEPQNVSKNSPQIIRIDPNSAIAETETILFDSIRYVTLETTKQSEFSMISQLTIISDRYVILDGNLDIILIFDKNGKFIKKIVPLEKNEVPFAVIYDYIVNEGDKTIVYRSAQTYDSHVYDLDGNFLRKETKKNAVKETALIKNVEAKYYDYNKNILKAEDKGYPNLITFDRKTGAKIESYLHFDPNVVESKELLSSSRFFYRSDDDFLLFNQPYHNTIYQLSCDGKLTEKYKLILPMENSIPQDFLTNPIYDGKRLKYVKDRSITIDNPRATPLFYKFENVYQKGNWLTLKFVGFRSLLYNLSTGDLYNLSRMEFTNWGIPNSKTLNKVLAIDGNALISYVDYRSIAKFYEDNPEDSRTGIKDLKGFLKKGFHNPILQLSYLKNI